MKTLVCFISTQQGNWGQKKIMNMQKLFLNTWRSILKFQVEGNKSGCKKFCYKCKPLDIFRATILKAIAKLREEGQAKGREKRGTGGLHHDQVTVCQFNSIHRVRTHLESPWKSLSFKIKIQGLESPWKLQSALESPWISVLTLSNTDSQVSKRSKHRKTYQGKIAHVVEEPKNWQTQGSFLH